MHPLPCGPSSSSSVKPAEVPDQGQVQSQCCVHSPGRKGKAAMLWAGSPGGAEPICKPGWQGHLEPSCFSEPFSPGTRHLCLRPCSALTCRFCLFVLSVIGSQSLGPSRWWHTSSLAMLHRLPLHDWARAAPLPDSTRLTQWQPSFSSHSWIWWKKWRGGLGGRAEHPAPPPLIPRPSVDERSPSLSL